MDVRKSIADTTSDNAENEDGIEPMTEESISWMCQLREALHVKIFIYLGVIALFSAIVLGGKVGIAEMDPVHYVPLHTLPVTYFFIYVLGGFSLIILLTWWHGLSFLLAKGRQRDLADTKERYFVFGLRGVQMWLLHLLTFLLPIALFVFLAERLSVWIYLLVGLSSLFFLSISGWVDSSYLWGDKTYRGALKSGLSFGVRHLKESFLFGFLTNILFLICCIIFLLPAIILKAVLYDAVSAEAMGEWSGLPSFVPFLEYICLFFTTALILLLIILKTSILRRQYLLIQTREKEEGPSGAEAIQKNSDRME